jgi:hypothetical protein
LRSFPFEREIRFTAEAAYAKRSTSDSDSAISGNLHRMARERESTQIVVKSVPSLRC